MPYLVLANPDQWKNAYHPNDFDIFKKIKYSINNENQKYLQNAKIGDKALLMITKYGREIWVLAVISSIDSNEVEFSFVKRLKPIDFNQMFEELYDEDIEDILDKNGNLKQNSIFLISDYIFGNILKKQYFLHLQDKMSRSFFIQFLKGNKYGNEISIRKISQLKYREVYKEENIIVGEIDEVLRKYEDIKLNPERIDLETIAYYSSYHNNGDSYGIYFNLGRFAKYLLENYKFIMKNYNINFKTSRYICFKKVLQHERFHYLTELFITQYEIVCKDYSLYEKYNEYYKNTFKTDKCYAEALANYFAKLYFINNGLGKYQSILNDMFRRQAPGYRLAAYIDNTNENYYFYEFEKQIFGNLFWDKYSSDLIGLNYYFDLVYNDNNVDYYRFGYIENGFCQTIKYISKFDDLLLGRLEIDGYLNIPLYIRNDGLNMDDFYYLSKLLFPYALD